MAPYDSPGKRQFIELLFALAKQSECRSYATFWGFGADSRRGAELGFDVIACEVTEAKHGAGRADASKFGYRYHAGRASTLGERVDVFHADFDGNASPGNFRELRAIAERTDHWLAVTLAGDHQLNTAMQGEAAAATIPAWLTFASGFTLEYLGRYQRNRLGQVMWTAILQRREGHGNSQRVQPVQIARSLAWRGYWASRPMYDRQLLHHTQPVPSERTVARQATYYQEHREVYMGRARSAYQRRKADPAKITRDRERTAQWRKTEAGRAAQRRYDQKRRDDPVLRERDRAYRREYYLRRRSIMARPAEPSEVREAA